MGKQFEQHTFWCIKCGNQGLPLMRNQGHQHERFHRKKLYCITCRQEINHIECKNIEDIEAFKDAFNNGIFLEESKIPVPKF